MLAFFLFSIVKCILLCSLIMGDFMGNWVQPLFCLIMAAIGFTTKKDLTSMGTFFLMGLIALIVASVVNIFLMSSALDWALSIVGVLLFCGLTAYDVQRFQKMGYMGFTDERSAGQMAVRGALNLYLDFINLFLYLLRLFGDRR